LGKISDALSKYAKERTLALRGRLTRQDLDALMGYDRKTGHLLSYNAETGQVGSMSMEALRRTGTLQRLLDNKLIFPGGKLTPGGVHECELQEKKLQASTSPPLTVPDSVEEPSPDETAIFNGVQQIEKESLQLKRQPSKTDAFRAKSQPTAEKPLSEVPPLEETAPIQSPPIRQPHQAKKTTPAKPPADEDIKSEVAETESISAEQRAPERVVLMEPKKIHERAAASRALFNEQAIDKNLVSLMDPQSHEAEQFKILRTNLLFPVSGKAPQSILVTSSVPGEGKSFVSANLAISIALNANKHVLLIDCDLRKPDISDRFGFGPVRGLTNYLTGQADLASLLLKTSVDKLTILPGGATPSNPSELMSSEKMAELLEEVKNRYSDRLIVIDTPPPSMAAETSFLARHVDGIIVVSKHTHTPREELEDLIDQMGSEKILGTVVNFVESRSRDYGYKKYGQYGRRYGYGKVKAKNKNA
jgi:exopolysaccharide/PEP-CTERM locus tyrosine autokinase